MSVQVLVVMGVEGSGKSTVATRLAKRLGWDFAEGDDFHPAANIAKMKSGEPLDDADRRPWLEAIARWIDGELASGRHGVVTCSALTRRYRDVLRRPGVRFVYLDVPEAELRRRLAGRTGHFMPPGLLDSQLATLERPGPDEDAITVAADPPERIVEAIEIALRHG
ncbi:MAG: gluconokinase [Conexibacteraceae bacterium]|nr:gluconokinase [Conexibacteraceae bacterium]